MVETFVECSNDMSKLGKTIRMLRERSGLNQAEFAEGICERTFLSKLENGARKAPSIVTLSRMCQKLNISMDDLFLLSFGDNDEILSVIVSDVNALIYSDRFEDAYELASKHLSEIKNPIYKQLFLLTKALYSLYNKDFDKSLFFVEEAINLTTSLTGPLYTLTELRLVNIFLYINIVEYRINAHTSVKETFSNFAYYLQHNYVQSYREIGYMYLNVCLYFLYSLEEEKFITLYSVCERIFVENKYIDHQVYGWMCMYLFLCIKSEYKSALDYYYKIQTYDVLFASVHLNLLNSHISYFSKRLGRDISPKTIKELIDNEEK